MDRNSIEVIFFDLGNVILPFNHYQIAEKLARFTKNGDFQDPKKIFSYLFDFNNGVINAYEVGKGTSLDFFQLIKDHLQLTLTFEAFKPIWNDIFWENKEVSEMIRSLKGKKRLGLLSNTNPLHFDYILSEFPVVKIFDKWLLSHEVGFKKPAREIFEKAIEWAGVEPEKTLFIDDMKGHVEVASSLGMQNIHFISSQDLKDHLRRFRLFEGGRV
jgi:putative hydrolase of the HAD superfamily